MCNVIEADDLGHPKFLYIPGDHCVLVFVLIGMWLWSFCKQILCNSEFNKRAGVFNLIFFCFVLFCRYVHSK